MSRRQAVRAAGLGFGAAVAAAFLPSRASGAPKACPPGKGGTACHGPGGQFACCPKGSTCCNGRCCTGDQICCGGTCCPAGASCCGGACCGPDQICCGDVCCEPGIVECVQNPLGGGTLICSVG